MFNLIIFGELEGGMRSYIKVELEFYSHHDNDSVAVKTLSLDELCAPTQSKIIISEDRKMKPLSNLLFADTFECAEKPIDIIIGTDQ